MNALVARRAIDHRGRERRPADRLRRRPGTRASCASSSPATGCRTASSTSTAPTAAASPLDGRAARRRATCRCWSAASKVLRAPTILEAATALNLRAPNKTAKKAWDCADRRRRAGRARRRRLRGDRGALDDPRRRGRARRPGEHLLADRELPRLPGRASPAPTWPSGRSPRRAASACAPRCPSGPQRCAPKTAATWSSSTAATNWRRAPSSSPPGRATGSCRSRGCERLNGAGRLLRGDAGRVADVRQRPRWPWSAAATRPARRRSSSPARSSGLPAAARRRPRRKAMSSYLVDQIESIDNIERPRSTPRSARSRGDTRARRDRGRGRPQRRAPRPRRRRPLHLHRRRPLHRVARRRPGQGRRRLPAHRRRTRGHPPRRRHRRGGRPALPLETSLPGVFAVGDGRSGSIKRVASAVGEGSMAVRVIHEYLALQASAD